MAGLAPDRRDDPECLGTVGSGEGGRYGALMTYPPPQYLGDSGLVNATHRTAQSPPELALTPGVGVSDIFTLYNGKEWSEAGPGDFHFVPKGGVHGFRNDHGAASMLTLFTPGAPP